MNRGGLRPNDRPLRPAPVAGAAARRLQLTSRFSLFATFVALLATVAWTPTAGWVFLALVLGDLVLWVARTVVLARAEHRRSSQQALLRIPAWTQLWSVALGVGAGVLAVVVLREVVTRAGLFVWPVFLLAASTTSWLLHVRRVRSIVRPVSGPLRSAQALDVAFRAARMALEGAVPATDGWENTLERCRRAVYEEAANQALAGGAANARALIWRSAACDGCGEDLAAAWDEVIEAARRGLADGEEQRASVGPPGLLE